jgi:3-phosphoshikimate 1-carboxyvinyltransferase
VTSVRIRPGPVHGSIAAPSSKSYTHRAVVAGFLARRRYEVVRPLRSADTRRTVAAVRALGARVEMARDRWTIAPGPVRRRAGRARIDCGESGTTLRFAAALASLSPNSVTLTGRGRLPLRPMGALAEALRSLGASVETPRPPRTLPMVVRGPIEGARVAVDATESSQFVSALLLALPTAHGASRLRLQGSPVSAPYIEATAAVLRASRIRFSESHGEFRLAGSQRFSGRRFEVPPDASSAAYLWAAAAIAGGSVTVRGLPDPWPQADLAILDLLVRYGARVRRAASGTTVTGGERTPFAVTLTDSPDLYPLAGVLAAAAPGTSRLIGAPHVASKESDRRRETIGLVRQMGASTSAGGGALRIRGVRSPRSFRLRGATDHRMVMSAAIGALAANGTSTIADASVVAKSFPGFWTALARIAGRGRIA